MITLDTDNIYSVSKFEELLNESLKRGTCYKTKHLSYYNSICAFDIETSNFTTESFEDHKDIYLYNYLKGAKIRVTDCEPVKHPYLTFSRKTGIYIDEYYDELTRLFHGTFPACYDPVEQQHNIIDVFEHNRPDLYDDSNKHSIMYCWQFAIDGRVIFGRTWEEVRALMDILKKYTSKEKRVIIWVHNLAFEFQFIRRFFEWKKVFAIAPRKPIYATTVDGIEFRCSYILTNYSLAKLSDQLQKYQIAKLDTLDYEKVRTPQTPMSWPEVRYCINDVLVVSAYIQECVITERTLANIPLTATGYCRRYVRKMCLYGTSKANRNKQYNYYHGLMQSLKIHDADEYLQMKRAFSGGFTHTSCRHSGKIMDNVDSIDFTSSYPYVCLSSSGFPMSSGRVVKPESREQFEEYLKYYWCMFDAEFIGLTPKYINENYISKSHCFIQEKVVNNNGRVVSADRIVTTITHIDFDIIRRTYKWQHLYIHNMRIYEKGYLPVEIIKSIIKLYQDKTILKGVKGKETEYLQGKALLNSVYGMMVTDLVRDEITYNDTWEEEPADIEKCIEKYNNNSKRFTFFAWGIHVVKVATYNLWLGLLNMGDDYIYADTDSLKILNFEKHLPFINAYNHQCEVKLKAMCNHYGLDYSELEPLTIKGEKKPLGVYDHDGHYRRFKALRAKCYMYEESDGHINITVSGVNKKIAVPYLLDTYGDYIFEAFSDKLEIPAGKTGKLTHVYIDYLQSGEVTDYQGNDYRFIDEPAGVYLEPTSYYFSLDAQYIDYIKGVQYYK